MTAAIFGLIGVVVGALLNATMQYLLARRQERAANLATARMLAIDLERVYNVIEARLRSTAWVAAQPWAHELTINEYSQRLNVLARSMPDAGWQKVADACAVVEKLRIGIASSWEESMGRERAILRELGECAAKIKAGRQALTAPTGWWLRRYGAIRSGLALRKHHGAVVSAGKASSGDTAGRADRDEG